MNEFRKAERVFYPTDLANLTNLNNPTPYVCGSHI